MANTEWDQFVTGGPQKWSVAYPEALAPHLSKTSLGITLASDCPRALGTVREDLSGACSTLDIHLWVLLASLFWVAWICLLGMMVHPNEDGSLWVSKPSGEE